MGKLNHNSWICLVGISTISMAISNGYVSLPEGIEILIWHWCGEMAHWVTQRCYRSWLVVWNIFYFPIYWEQSSQLTFIFFRGVAQPPTRKVLSKCFGSALKSHGRKFGVSTSKDFVLRSTCRYQLRSCGIAGGHPTEFVGPPNRRSVDLWTGETFCQVWKENLCISITHYWIIAENMCRKILDHKLFGIPKKDWTWMKMVLGTRQC